MSVLRLMNLLYQGKNIVQAEEREFKYVFSRDSIEMYSLERD